LPRFRLRQAAPVRRARPRSLRREFRGTAPAQDGLPLQGQRGDWIGDSVDQELAPGQGRKIRGANDAKRRAFEQIGKSTTRRVIGDDRIMRPRVAKTHPVAPEPFAVVIDEHRHDGCSASERRHARRMIDAVLHDGNVRLRPA
jgi:hypothetical protein